MKKTNRSAASILSMMHVVFFLFSIGSPLCRAEDSANLPSVDPVEIVAKADSIRFPEKGFQVDVHISSIAPDKEDDKREYRVMSNGIENTIVMTTSPASDRGQIMLMKGRDLWVFMPSISQPVRLPLSQRLTGQVANGDLARANFRNDYMPKLVKIEDVEGQKNFVLELTAIDSGVTYSKVVYWVNQRSFRPYKAEFYTLSGRLLKVAYYKNYQALGGETRPTQLILEDAMNSGEKSILDYKDMVQKELPEKMFTKDYLKKLE